jgi:hypothetical protein
LALAQLIPKTAFRLGRIAAEFASAQRRHAMLTDSVRVSPPPP